MATSKHGGQPFVDWYIVVSIKIKDLRYADDVDLLAFQPEELQNMLDTLDESGSKLGLAINVNKTKIMAVGKGARTMTIKVGGQEIEWVGEFVYLGSLLCADGDCSPEIRRRIGLASGALGCLSKF